MPKKKAEKETIRTLVDAIPLATIEKQPITDTIEKNYMPYVMTVIISRAIPEIDGLKPSHRKLLYTMYKMGLLSGARTKSANVVGQTMRLNPHGDAAIYETMVRLTKGNEALLHPFVDSKGSFGKQYSREMAYAASRYTEVKLDAFCTELFRGIDKNAVEFIDNYDNTTKEPVLLPTSFPNILVSPNTGIAVGMASNICSFNLAEVCDGTIQLLKDPNTTIDQILDIIKAPDFSGGGYLLYNREQLREIYTTGRGNFTIRSKYVYDKEANCIDIVQIPYSTSIELILKRISDLVKDGKVKEIMDFRDEIDVTGFKLTLDLRRGTDPDRLMARLFQLTPLQDDFNCNFNLLIDGAPIQMGIGDILEQWIRFRMKCVKREFQYELERKQEKLHLLLGLEKILLDIDLAIKIVRETGKETEVVPNLQAGFNLDQIQAEYIAEIKLRNLNREYILNRLKEIETLQKEIEELENQIQEDGKIKAYIGKQLREIKAKYGKERKTEILYEQDLEQYDEEQWIENYNVKLVLTQEGYFKKITMQSLRGNDEQKLKENDCVRISEDSQNTAEILFFSDKAQVYKAKVSDFDSVKASVLGDYIPAKLGFEDGERVIWMKSLSSYVETHSLVFLFANGKGVRIPMSAYQTKTNRRKLTNAYSDASPVVGVFYEESTMDLLLVTNTNSPRALLVRSDQIALKTTRTSVGGCLFTLKGKQKIAEVWTEEIWKQRCSNPEKYRKGTLPSTGAPITLEQSTVAF